MGYRSVALAIVLSLGCALLAAGCSFRAHLLGEQAAWLLLRGNAEASEYVASFDGRHVDQQLAAFQARRAVLERAHRWQSGSSALVLASVLLVVGSYGLFLLARLREQKLASPGAPPAPSHTVLQVR